MPAVSPKNLAIFRVLWRTVNGLLIFALLFVGYSSVWEYSVRRYLKGFSDAIIPSSAAPKEKIESILTWIRAGAPRSPAQNLNELSARDPEDTLNSSQLLTICGTATNAFLNLSRSAGLRSRRLLLLTPEHTTKHVVAEVLVDGRWIIVDPTYRTILRDAQGHTLTRKDLQNPVIFDQATSSIPGYLPGYNYQKFAHVRSRACPLMLWACATSCARFIRPGMKISTGVYCSSANRSFSFSSLPCSSFFSFWFAFYLPGTPIIICVCPGFTSAATLFAPGLPFSLLLR